MISQERLKELLNYDPETGVFTWKFARQKCKAGGVAGNLNELSGYMRITIDGRSYRSHQLAWLYVHGVWPSQLDHKSRIRSSAKISDLRIATNSQNAANSSVRQNSASGYKGVTWVARENKWQAQIRVNYKLHWLGYFDCPIEASKVYAEAAKKFFGEFANA